MGSKKLGAYLICTSIFLYASIGSTQDRETAQKLFGNLEISNTNQCAQQSQKAASSIYLFIDGYIPGRAALNAAGQLNEALADSAYQSWGQFHRAASGLTMKILNGLATGDLKTLSQAEINLWSPSCLHERCANDVAQNWSRYENLEKKSAKAFCHEAIQPLPSMFATHMQKKEELEKIALSYLEAEKYIRTCDNIPEKRQTPDGLYKFSTGLDSKSISFEFWESYKIYFSWTWRNSNYLDSAAPNYSKVFKALTLEDSLVMIPEGCYSLKKPECGTDDLSESHLRTMGDNKLFRLTAKGTAETLRDTAIVHPTKWLEKLTQFDVASGKPVDILVDPRAARTIEVDNYRGYLLNTMDSRVRTAAIADASLTFLQTLLNQRNPEQLVMDVQAVLNKTEKTPEDLQEFDVMCAEVFSIKEKDISFFASELDRSKGIFANLKSLNFPGLPPQVLIDQSLSALDQLLPICREVAKANSITPAKYLNANKLKMGIWYQRLSSNALDTSVVGLPTPPPQDVRSKKYLLSSGQGLCANEMQCIRMMMESIADLYAVALYSNSLFGTGPGRSHRMSENFSNAVTCGKYDPWYEAQHRQKKLFLDVASAVAQAALPIPFYIEIDQRRPEVMSFKDRVDSGQIKFAPEMTPTKYDATAYLDFGPITGTSCAISLGLKGQQAPSSKLYAFTGVSGSLCSKERDSKSLSVSMGTGGVTERNVDGKAICGSCTYQFAPIRNSESYLKNVRYWGAGLRIFQGVLKFFASKKSLDMPRSFTINPQAVAETYSKYNGIPNECVWELHHGARCMKNLCVSSAVGQFERMTGQKVKDANVYSAQEESGGLAIKKQIWMKLESCEGEVAVTATCEDDEAAQPLSRNRFIVYGDCRKVVK